VPDIQGETAHDSRTSVSKSDAAKRKINFKNADARKKHENQIEPVRPFGTQGVDVVSLEQGGVCPPGCCAGGFVFGTVVGVVIQSGINFDGARSSWRTGIATGILLVAPIVLQQAMAGVSRRSRRHAAGATS
jgi:hypothetical protein